MAANFQLRKRLNNERSTCFFPTFIMISTNDFVPCRQCCQDCWIRLVPGVWEKWWKIWNQPGNNFSETSIRSYMMEMPPPRCPLQFFLVRNIFSKVSFQRYCSSCLKVVDKKSEFPPVARWGDTHRKETWNYWILRAFRKFSFVDDTYEVCY